MTDRELMQQALEALEIESKGYADKVTRNRRVITALRERLAQPEQLKLSCGVDYADGLLTVSVVRGCADGSMEVIHCEQIAMPIKAQQETRPATREEKIVHPGMYEVTGPLHVVCKCDKCKAQPEQEPVATVESKTGNPDILMSWWHEPALPVGTKLYTTPPRREWVGLTEGCIDALAEAAGTRDVAGITYFTGRKLIRDFARAIEAKLKEKNA